MKANELRIGNYIELEGETIPIKAVDFDELYSDPFDYNVNGRPLSTCMARS